MGVGATLSFLVFRTLGGPVRSPRGAGAAAFVATLAGFVGSATVLVGSMSLGGKELATAAWISVLTHGVLAPIEAVITAVTVGFVVRVQPRLLRCGTGPAR